MKEFLPCSVCQKHVRKNAKAVCCDICDKWVHISCNNITNKKYQELKDHENNETFFCSTCFNSTLPFGKENDKVFSQTNILGLNCETNLDDLSFKLSNYEQKYFKYAKVH